MAIRTIEQAISSMGDKLKRPQVAALARDALQRGQGIEVVMIVRPAKQGAVVSMEARDCTVTKFGTFIRLT